MTQINGNKEEKGGSKPSSNSGRQGDNQQENQQSSGDDHGHQPPRNAIGHVDEKTIVDVLMANGYLEDVGNRHHEDRKVSSEETAEDAREVQKLATDKDEEDQDRIAKESVPILSSSEITVQCQLPASMNPARSTVPPEALTASSKLHESGDLLERVAMGVVTNGSTIGKILTHDTQRSTPSRSEHDKSAATAPILSPTTSSSTNASGRTSTANSSEATPTEASAAAVKQESAPGSPNVTTESSGSTAAYSGTAIRAVAHTGPGAYALAPVEVDGRTAFVLEENLTNEQRAALGMIPPTNLIPVTAAGTARSSESSAELGSSSGDDDDSSDDDDDAEEERQEQHGNVDLIEAHAVDDVVEVHAKPIEWWTPHKVRMFIVGTLSVLVIVIVIAVTVVVRNSNKDDEETPVPTLPPAERWEVMKSILLTEAYSQNYTDPARDLLEDPESPQYKALEWIAWEDGYHVPSDDVQHIIQRYALGVLYYSTSGENWMESYEFLQPEHECSWSGALSCKMADDGVSQIVTGIDLQENQLEGRLPAEELGFLKSQLEILDLSKNKLSGTLPPAMPQLTYLNLGRCQFTGVFPEEYTTMVRLEHFDAKMNYLSGDIPADFGALTKLTTLDIESNYLDGSVPESMWDLSSMERFIIESQNTLRGTISPKVGLWENITVFLVNMNNGFEGSIPTEVGLLTKLEEFKTAQNHMRGPIPSEMGLLTNLKFFALSRNGYQGSVPSELALLSNLHQLFIQATWLTGEMVEFCDAFDSGGLPYLKTLIADQAEVNCTCCTCCRY